MGYRRRTAPDASSSIVGVQRRYVILAMAAVLVLGIVTPVFSSPRRPGAQARQAGEGDRQERPHHRQPGARARRSRPTRLAQRRQRSARRDRRSSPRQRTALVTSTAPIGDYEALGGPSVEVTVPPSGLIEVWAQADIRQRRRRHRRALRGRPDGPGYLRRATSAATTRRSVDVRGGGPGDFDPVARPSGFSRVVGCDDIGAPLPVLLQRHAGQPHLRAALFRVRAAADEAEFQNRILRIAPKP